MSDREQVEHELAQECVDLFGIKIIVTNSSGQYDLKDLVRNVATYAIEKARAQWLEEATVSEPICPTCGSENPTIKVNVYQWTCRDPWHDASPEVPPGVELIADREPTADEIRRGMELEPSAIAVLQTSAIRELVEAAQKAHDSFWLCRADRMDHLHLQRTREQLRAAIEKVKERQ